MGPSRRRKLEMTDLSSESKMGAALGSRCRRLTLGLVAALAMMALVAPTALARPADDGVALTLHRDGSKADPFVADLTRTAARLPTASTGETPQSAWAPA